MSTVDSMTTHRRRKSGGSEPARGTAGLEEQRLRVLLDSVEDYAVFMLDPQGKVLSWNHGAELIKGYRPDEIIGRHFSLFYAESDLARGHPEYELQVARDAGRYEEEGWRVRKDGTRFFAHVLITAIRDADGQLTGFAKVTRDITVSREMSAALRRSAQILDLANDTIFVRDASDHITYWNECAHRTYGWSAEEALGRVTHELLQTRFPMPLASILDTVRKRRHWEGELEHTARDGRELRVESRWSLLFDDVGEASGIIEVNHDITERERISAELRVANSRLHDAMHTKDNFLATMSHELRTPLNGIIGFSELLHSERPGPLNERQKEFLGDILHSSRHLLTLINDILDLSKVAAGKMDLHPAEFVPAEAIRQVCSSVQVMREAKNIELRLDLAAAPSQVRLDPTRFRQVLWNLLSNAVKFTGSGGWVEVSARAESADRFRVSVADSGIGIAAGDMPRLFAAFEQVSSGSSRQFQGTGLGLALTRRLVDLQGGAIQVRSTPGVGSVFTVELPIRAAAEA